MFTFRNEKLTNVPDVIKYSNYKMLHEVYYIPAMASQTQNSWFLVGILAT